MIKMQWRVVVAAVVGSPLLPCFAQYDAAKRSFPSASNMPKNMPL
jgi:hypothetical protein